MTPSGRPLLQVSPDTEHDSVSPATSTLRGRLQPKRHGCVYRLVTWPLQSWERLRLKRWASARMPSTHRHGCRAARRWILRTDRPKRGHHAVCLGFRVCVWPAGATALCERWSRHSGWPRFGAHVVVILDTASACRGVHSDYQLNGLNAATSSGAMKSRTAPPQHRTSTPRTMAIHSVAGVLLRRLDRMDGVSVTVAARGNPYAGPCGDYPHLLHRSARSCGSRLSRLPLQCRGRVNAASAPSRIRWKSAQSKTAPVCLQPEH
jgi:hypothetical protein